MSFVSLMEPPLKMSSSDQPDPRLPLLDTLPTEEFLLVVGQRVRRQRTEKGMSRKRLAEVSGVSERYLAQLESGQGNMSIALLRKVTRAIGMSLGDLMAENVTETCADVQPSAERVSVVAEHALPNRPQDNSSAPPVTHA